VRGSFADGAGADGGEAAVAWLGADGAAALLEGAGETVGAGASICTG
jgi:hypothetical protein